MKAPINPAKWGHDQLQEDLASHLRGSRDRVVWTNMQLGPSGSPRPDVFTMPKSYSKFTPIAYECKISVSDFRRDVTSGKWQSYLKFASGLIFAVPAGLIKKEDVPPGCGLIVRHEEVWRTVKGPTLRAIPTLPHEAWMKLMIDGLDRQTHDPQPRIASPWHVQTEVRRKYGDKIADALSALDNAEYRLSIETAKTEKTIEQLQAAERERVKYARESVERELAQVSSGKAEFCALLGLPVGASYYAIQHAVNQLVTRLGQDGEINRMRRNLENAQRALTEGLKPLPGVRGAAGEWAAA